MLHHIGCKQSNFLLVDNFELENKERNGALNKIEDKYLEELLEPMSDDIRTWEDIRNR